MNSESELAPIRDAYAKQVLNTARINDVRLEHAFATIPREHFLGEGPWQIFHPGVGYIETADSNPAQVYVDQPIALLPARQLNNGQPSLHAILLAHAGIRNGDQVVHIGAGTGYYTALMSYLVGESGRVTAIEFDPELTLRARTALVTYPNVSVLQGDGGEMSLQWADVIYVNAGVTRPANNWLNALNVGGRLIIPFTTDANFASTSQCARAVERPTISGAYFSIRRSETGFDAQGLLPTTIIPSVTLRDEQSEVALATAFKRGGWEQVKHLVVGEDAHRHTCWVCGHGWALTL